MESFDGEKKRPKIFLPPCLTAAVIQSVESFFVVDSLSTRLDVFSPGGVPEVD